MNPLSGRLALIRTLSTLSAAEFAQVVFTLDTPIDILPGAAVSPGERAAALLNWANSPTGPGLPAVSDLLGQWTDNARSAVHPVRYLNPGAPFLAPPLPKHYVSRPEHFDAVKAILLDGSAPDTLVISAIYGMGGIGKSVLAAALVQEPDIQRRFPNGILWVTLGQQPDLLPMVNLWIRELGDYDYNPTTLQAASLHLRTLLADKRSLLVVDDVWYPEHVEPFRIGGAGCSVLVTTRETKIIGATRYDLELMTPQQSLDLLTKCLPNSLSAADQAQAKTFAREVGYLPLALELAAAQIEYGVTWEELLDAFQAEMAYPEALDLDSNVELINDEAIRKRRSLVASFKLTLKLLSRQQLKQFAWFGIVPEDVSLTQPMAATLWGVNSLQAGKILRDFRNRALLISQAQRAGEAPTYRIHDLVHDLAKNLLTHEQYLGELPGLGLTVKQAHAQFLERYRSQTQDGLWHTVPDDGYIHSHLAWHFEQAQQSELLHQLLRESTPDGSNGWYEACERLGQTANFVTDVARAWQAAEDAFIEDSSGAIILQCRYALIFSSLNNLADNIPAELIAALVKQQLWMPTQGLAYVQQIQEPYKLVEALKELAPYLPLGLLPTALEVAQKIPDEFERGDAFKALAPYLTEELLIKLLAALREIQRDWAQALTLRRLIIYLPESLLPEALDISQDMQDEWSRSNTMMDLIPHLPEALLPGVLVTARKITHVQYRAMVLSSLVSRLPEVIPEVLEAVQETQYDWWGQAYALNKLAPYLSEIRPEALKAVRGIKNQADSPKALKALAPYLTEELLQEALEILQEIQDERIRAEALRELIPYLSEILISESLKAAREMQEGRARVMVLTGLAAQIPEVLSEALDIVREMPNPSDQADALEELAPYLPETILTDAWEVAKSLQHEELRARALSKLVPHLPKELLSEVLEIARKIQHGRYRAESITALALYEVDNLSTNNLLVEALKAAQVTQDKFFQATALIKLVSYVPEILPEAIETARQIQNTYDRAVALNKLINHSPEILLEAIETARQIQNTYDRAVALNKLINHSPEILPEAIETARQIQNTYDRAVALNKLINHSPEILSETVETTRKALEIEQRNRSDFGLYICVRRLAPYAPKTLLLEMLKISQDIKNEFHRALALRDLAPYLSKFLLAEALKITRAIQDKRSRTLVLVRLAIYWPEIRTKALEATQEFLPEGEQIEELSKLAPHVPNILLKVLETLPQMKNFDRRKARVLRELVPCVPESLLPQVLEVTRGIQSKYYQAEALSPLALRLNPACATISLWQELLHTLAHRHRRDFLADISVLTPMIIALGGTEALAGTANTLQEVGRQWP